jgi:hypothetical protein
MGSTTGCDTDPVRPDAAAVSRGNAEGSVALLNRLTCGVGTLAEEKVNTIDFDAFVRQQLYATAAKLLPGA